MSKLIFACCGGSDLGEIADRTARKLTKEGVGQMYCTAGIGGRVGKIISNTESAEKILAIDGCALNCVKNSLEKAGFRRFCHLQLTDLGFVKGSSPANEENINKAAQKAKEIMSA